jgi:hypothetical protein
MRVNHSQSSQNEIPDRAQPETRCLPSSASLAPAAGRCGLTYVTLSNSQNAQDASDTASLETVQLERINGNVFEIVMEFARHLYVARLEDGRTLSPSALIVSLAGMRKSVDV